jgi:DNA invertase Pin-like site-specific DNA recombinase
MTAEPGTKIVIYARVSTNGKTHNGAQKQNTDTQLDPMRAYCQQRGWVIVDEFVDNGVSGSKASRPALDRLMAAATSPEKPFDAILVWKLDRFGRSLQHLMNAIATLKDHGVAFVSMTDGFDLTTSQGKLMFGMLGCFAEFERDLIRERVTAGIKRAQAEAAKAGRKRGAGRKAFTLDLGAIQDRIFLGESQRQIAKSLDISPSLITKRLRAVETH